MKIIYNTSDKDIKDYPISEAQVDAAGNIMYDKDGKMLITTRTLTWSIAAGETVKMPAYVADYLMQVAEFIKEKPGEETTEEVKETIGGDICPKCGKTFKGAKAKALHYAAKHPELLP